MTARRYIRHNWLPTVQYNHITTDVTRLTTDDNDIPVAHHRHGDSSSIGPYSDGRDDMLMCLFLCRNLYDNQSCEQELFYFQFSSAPRKWMFFRSLVCLQLPPRPKKLLNDFELSEAQKNQSNEWLHLVLIVELFLVFLRLTNFRKLLDHSSYLNYQHINGVFTRSSKRPANFQQMYSKYTC